MSPHESDLRAALAAGEGERPSADAVVALARAAAGARRRRLGAIAGGVAAVVAVAGVITGVQLSRHDSGSYQPLRSGSPVSPVAGCPAVAPQVPGTGPGSPGGSTAGAPLNPTGVDTVTVCGWPDGRRTGYGLTGTAATDLVGQLAAAARPGVASSQVCLADQGFTVELVARYADGASATAIGSSGGCGFLYGDGHVVKVLGILEQLGARLQASGAPPS